MSNLPILYFTLGALVGLPVGYGFEWLCDPEEIARMVCAIAFEFRGIDAEMGALQKSFALNGINPKVTA